MSRTALLYANPLFFNKSVAGYDAETRGGAIGKEKQDAAGRETSPCDVVSL